MKKKGFSLIEVLIVLGIIGLFTSFLVPKVSRYLALGKETKVISTLESLRTASEAYYFTTGEALGKDKLTGDNTLLTKEDLEKLEEYLGGGYKKLAESGGTDSIIVQELGGSKVAADGDITYGGEVNFTFEDPNKTEGEGKESDGIRMWISPVDGGDDGVVVGEYNMQGEKWVDL